MNNKEINSLIESLNASMWAFENYMVENEGVCDEASDQMEEQIGILKELLTTEGIDSLGRWLKAKEHGGYFVALLKEKDEIKSLKAEKDYITRKINAATGTIDYIKTQMNKILTAAQMEEIKGANGYKFKVTTSTKTEVDKEILKALFLDKVEKKLRGGKNPVIPADVTFSLGASVSLVPEGAKLPSYYMRTSSPSCQFSKPRASKEVK